MFLVIELRSNKLSMHLCNPLHRFFLNDESCGGMYQKIFFLMHGIARVRFSRIVNSAVVDIYRICYEYQKLAIYHHGSQIKV